MSNGAGKGPRPRPVNMAKKNKCELWNNRKHARLKPGEKIRIVYGK